MMLLLPALVAIMLQPISVLPDMLKLPRSDVLHASSGLIFHYLSDYSPANRIASFTVSIPMTIDMCYLIPVNAIRKIPHCHQLFNASHQPSPRTKRFVTGAIAIGIGTTALALATHNTVQILKLQNEMKRLTSSLSTMNDQLTSHTAQLFQLSNGQMKLAHVLNHTQQALNRTIALVNDHATVLERHRAAIESLALFAQDINNKLTSFIQSTENHFLRTAISNILANRLNLNFMHHHDLPTALDFIISSTNVSFNPESTTMPLVELVSRLLVQQRIDFAPNSESKQSRAHVIGFLLISSFFAATTQDQSVFPLYELLPIPFPFRNTRVRLADVPFIIGVNFENNHLLRWSKDEADTCHFNAMSLCRESPPIITNWNNTCLFEILTETQLHSCRTERYSDPIFVHRIGSHWAISTNFSTSCHSVSMSPLNQNYALHEAERILPPVSLITVAPNTTLVCDRFSIPSLPISHSPPLTILDSTFINASTVDFFDIHVSLTNDTRWKKLSYIPGHFQAILDFLATTSSTPIPHTVLGWSRHPFSSSTMVLMVVLSIGLFVLLYLHFCRTPAVPTVRFELPVIA